MLCIYDNAVLTLHYTPLTVQREESNLRLPALQAGALSTELQLHRAENSAAATIGDGLKDVNTFLSFRFLNGMRGEVFLLHGCGLGAKIW